MIPPSSPKERKKKKKTGIRYAEMLESDRQMQRCVNNNKTRKKIKIKILYYAC